MLLVFGFLTLSCGTFSCAATLPELNQSTAPNRSYTFTSDKSATLEEDMGVTSSGKFTITGLNKNSNSIIFNSYSGFVVKQIQTTLDISNVTISGAQSTVGSVIYNTASDASITLSNLNIESNSVLSQEDALGGAIYSNSEMTIKNTSFKGNSATTEGSGTSAKGGAIYARKDINLIADSDNVEIVDNYTQSGSGNDDNAIYMANASTLTLEAKNKGRINLHDNVNGDNGYNVNITGDGTGKAGLYNDIKNADSINVSNIDVTTANSKTENINLNNLNIGNNVNFTVDVDLENETADTITSNGTGTVNLSEISVIAGSEDEKTVQVLKNTGSLELNIDKLQSKRVSELQSTMFSNSILADSITLATTDTTNDSFTISGWKDVLYEMVKDSNPNHMIKNFIINTDTEYVLTKDLTNMAQESILTIYNTSDSERGTINANNHSLFKLDNPISSVTLKDIVIKNAHSAENGAVANLANNTANFTAYNSILKNNTSDSNGGAIYVENGSVSLNDTTVSNNTAAGDGGAMYITNEANVELVNVNFTDNTSGGKGGAIYTDKNLKVTAENGTSTFSGNTANGESNAIYVGSSDAAVTLYAGKNSTINMNDGISGTDDKYKLNLTGSSQGKINLNDSVTNANVTMNNITLNMGKDNLLQGDSLNLQSGVLNLQNGKVGNMDLSHFSLSGNAKVKVDVDLYNQTMDRVNADSYGSVKGTINVSSINILKDSKSRWAKVFFADPAEKKHVKTSLYKVYSPVYRYFVRYDKSSGYFIFNRGPEDISWWFNPAVLSSAIAQQAAYMNQLNNYNTALYHSDTYMTLPREVREHTGNLFDEETDTMTYYQIQEQVKSIWIRPFTSIEHISLRHGPKVSSLNYGTLIGGDSDMIDIGHGFKYVYSGYVGYNGNNFKFENVNALQQGALIGGTAYLYKGNFYNALTANIGWMINDSETIYGTDIMNLLMTGFSDRVGYNFELKNGKVIIQPSLTMGYTIVMSEDYTTRNNVHIDADPLHAVHFMPSLKIIGNLANGWQPYATINVVCSFLDQTDMMANHVRLPRMAVDPYVEYGIGIQKRWDDKYSGFAQATIRNGGRKGGSFLMGFRYMLGQIINTSNRLPHADARPRKVLFKERKRPDITIDPIKQKFKPEKRKVDKREKSEKPGFRLNVFDVFKKLKKKVTYSYNTDVSAKVVTDTFDDGVIMPSLKGMKNPKKGEMNDYRDEDRLNPLSENERGTIIKEVEETVKTQEKLNKVNPAVQPQPKQEVKPQQPVQKQEVKPVVQPQVKQVTKPAQGVNKEVKPVQEVKSTSTPKQTETKSIQGDKSTFTPKPAETKPVQEVKSTFTPKPKTNNIQRRPKSVNKTLYLNQTKYEEKTKTEYKDYDLEIIKLKF